MRGSAVFRTGLGWAGVALTGRGVCRVALPRSDRASALRELGCPVPSGGPGPSVLARAIGQLQSYFSGRPVSFDLPLDLGYYTAFQRAVWHAARAIPHGETRSYGWIAARIKRPGASRAVGQALGANPVPIIIP